MTSKNNSDVVFHEDWLNPIDENNKYEPEEEDSEHEHSQRDDQHGGHARLLPDARRRETVRREQRRVIDTVAACRPTSRPS